MSTEHSHSVEKESYLTPTLVFFNLFGLTLITVLLSGAIESNKGSLFAALFVACIKAFLVVHQFMHVGHEGKLFKIFIGIAVGTLISIFVLLFTDYLYR
ncbi:MAG: cytochrome C oxidase subunit IV family protein [Fibrobacterales bacterium]